MATHPYDATVDPPLPVLPVVVRGVDRREAVTLVGVADTGADVTVVPEEVARRLLVASGTRTIVGVGGPARSAVAYRAEIAVDGRTELVDVIGWGVETIVGRDLLNGRRATFDGPRLVLELD